MVATLERYKVERGAPASGEPTRRCNPSFQPQLSVQPQLYLLRGAGQVTSPSPYISQLSTPAFRASLAFYAPGSGEPTRAAAASGRASAVISTLAPLSFLLRAAAAPAPRRGCSHQFVREKIRHRSTTKRVKERKVDGFPPIRCAALKERFPPR